MRKLVILLILLSLSGCASFDFRNETPQSLIDKSNLLVKQKRWVEADELLSEAVREFPNDKQLQAALTNVQQAWQSNKLRLEDWILLYETESMLLQRPLLISMAQSDPDSLILMARVKLHESSLRSKRDLMIACAENHLGTELKLARRCIEAARKINASTQVKILLENITTKQEQIKKKQVAQNKAQKRNAAIKQSKKYLQENAYFKVIQLLEPLLTENQDDPELSLLFQEAKTGRDLQILQLISYGDKLYRAERIKEALAIWKKAQELDPNLEELTTRITRANTVLEQIQKIKEDK